jgi:RNA polymerase sigma factor (sigma-70 family)
VILLVSQCLDGNHGAWKSFAKEFSSIAKNIIGASFELPSEEQDDVVQNVFIKLIRGGLRNFNGTSKYEFLKYFKMIVLNETRTYLASRKGEAQIVSFDDPLFQGPDVNEGSSFSIGESIQESNKGAVPEALLEERDLLERVVNIIRDEPLLDKQVFLMKIEGYKDEEIKQILQIPLGTVASKFSRIRVKIRQELGE